VQFFPTRWLDSVPELDICSRVLRCMISIESSGIKPIRGQLMRRRSLCTVEDNDAIIHVNGERYV
jgi:hypothetical protein